MTGLSKIPFLTISFSNRLLPSEVTLFRGAVLSKVPKEFILFHNHDGSGFRLAYPLIQYKSISGHAAITCVGEGTSEIGAFFSNADFDVCIGERRERLEVQNVWAKQWLLQTWSDEFTYSIRRWLPLNKKNYELFKGLDGVVERTELLERILVGNILSMSNGLGRYMDSRVTCKIVDISNTRMYRFKEVSLMGYDIEFKSNVYFPDMIGLGKGTSVGFGVVKQRRKKQAKDYSDGSE